MKKLLPLLLLALSLGITGQAQLHKTFDEVYGQPLLVLTETNPRLMVAGADVPTFALYEGGQIIYLQQSRKENRYMQTRMAQEQLQEFIASLLISEDLLQLPTDTAASQLKNQPTAELILNFDTLLVKRVYGDLRNDKKARQQAPLAFLKVYDKLLEFKDSQAREWLPEKIEVLVTDYRKDNSQSQKWPEGWPTLKSPDTVWRSEKLYSLYLDNKHYKELQRFIHKLKNKQAVEMNGNKFAISYRLPFPNIQ